MGVNKEFTGVKNKLCLQHKNSSLCTHWQAPAFQLQWDERSFGFVSADNHESFCAAELVDTQEAELISFETE